MPKRFNAKQRAEIDRKLTIAEGDFCLICKFKFHRIRRDRLENRKPGRQKIILGHTDGNPENNTLGVKGNIHHFCRSCNKLMESWDVEGTVRLIQGYSALLEREREREGLTTWKDAFPDDLDYSQASIEIQLSKRYYQAWEKYVRDILNQVGYESKNDLIADAANAARCKPNTSRNYMTLAMAKRTGWLKEVEIDGIRMIGFRGKE